MDNTLAYIDQASFLGLRALGRGPLIQFTWVYDRPVDLDGLRRFHRNLGHGLLGRRVERSPLPFGRHRWVAATGPANLDVAADDRPRDDVWTWADERADLPIDPEYGPQWHLGVQPLIGGGAAVSLVVSHTTGDGLAICHAVADAVNGVRRDLGYPLPSSRTRRQALAQDARQAVRAVPDMGRAVAATVRVARSQRDELASSMSSARAQPVTGETRTVVAPCVLALVDIDQWDSRAKALGGNSNSLLAGFAARVGYLLGRTDDAGLVTLSYPVSERVEGDTRGNALTEARMKADPVRVTTDLTELRATMKRQFAALRDKPNELLAPLPLTPLTPRVLVRRLESMIVERGAPIGCSNLGDLDPAVNRPDGTDAAFLAPRIVEPKITTTILDKSGGLLFIGSCRLGGLVSVTVAAWRPGGTNTKDALREVVDQALGDFGLTATVEPEPHRLHKA
ncbi:hypothetical protein NIIDNTM18_40420 [Mycolicibacterium litorale]|uniref:Diacylglycerol O-acyltransferase n=1 Tax=Mycolicibacterium litorale TaxID=758802 RepID=A0A6S6P7Z8_9MYCO|nr:hypothetical protein [Mycolicibacterium litorale]BCI54764.1 hypothetical protein NIIDNTM18_40420 [Mycolicibacterium litorale]